MARKSGDGSAIVVACGQAQAVLFEVLATGLARAGETGVSSLRRGAKRAGGAGLVRVARAIDHLANSMSGHERPAGAVTLALIAWWWVRRARRAPDDPMVLGEKKRTTVPLPGKVQVRALGATGWAIAGGPVGITLHLWDETHDRRRDAVVSRPRAVLDDPRRLLFAPISDATPLVVFELAHGRWELDDVRVGLDGRLSLHRGLLARHLDEGTDLPTRTDVDALWQAIAEVPLDPVDPAPSVLAAVDVARLDAFGVDPVRARAHGVLVTPSSDRIAIDFAVGASSQLLVENLARIVHGEASVVALYGRVRAISGKLFLEPFTAWFASPQRLDLKRRERPVAVHLSLEPLPGQVTPPILPQEAQNAVSVPGLLQAHDAVAGVLLVGTAQGGSAAVVQAQERFAADGIAGITGLLGNLDSALASGDTDAASTFALQSLAWLRVAQAQTGAWRADQPPSASASAASARSTP